MIQKVLKLAEISHRYSFKNFGTRSHQILLKFLAVFRLTDSHSWSLVALNKELIYLRIAINHPDEFFNVVDNAIVLEGGTEVNIRIIPEEIATDDNVGSEVSIKKRNCRMKNEVTDEMLPLFKSYSQNACLYSCMYNYA